MLVTLSLATSVDALAVGVSMALLQVSIWTPCIVIGLVAAAVTTIGIHFGGRLGLRWGRRAEMVGGGVLLLISLQPLFRIPDRPGGPIAMNLPPSPRPPAARSRCRCRC